MELRAIERPEACAKSKHGRFLSEDPACLWVRLARDITFKGCDPRTYRQLPRKFDPEDPSLGDVRLKDGRILLRRRKRKRPPAAPSCDLLLYNNILYYNMHNYTILY